MKKFLELLTMVALLVWGAIFIWFYVSGKIERYLDPSFWLWALLAGIGFIILALFNLLTRNRSAGCCHHEHAHGDACDHDHHHHEHGEHCDHDHGHDHSHSHSHGDKAHSHSDDHDHDHDHHEETASSLAFALLILLIPMLMAARYSEDSFSMGYLTKWDKIERQMQKMRLAEKREAAAKATTSPQVASSDDPAAEESKMDNPYTADAVRPADPPEKANTVAGADTPPNKTKNAENGDKTATAAEHGTDTPPEGDTEDSDEGDEWGEFTLEDLKKMVPQSSEGNFLLDVPQIFYTAGDQELMEVMDGIPVETTAQVMEESENNEGAKRLRAFRLFIECCAADARPIVDPD